MKTLAVTSSKSFLIAALIVSTCFGSASPESPPRVDAAPGRVLIVQNYYYALPGKAEDVYLLRLHASEVRAKLGLPRGRVLRRLTDAAADKLSPALPDVVWECEYPSREAREADVARLSKSVEFAEVEKHMDTLILDFRRVMFEAG